MFLVDDNRLSEPKVLYIHKFLSQIMALKMVRLN